MGRPTHVLMQFQGIHCLVDISLYVGDYYGLPIFDYGEAIGIEFGLCDSYNLITQ